MPSPRTQPVWLRRAVYVTPGTSNLIAVVSSDMQAAHVSGPARAWARCAVGNYGVSA